MVLPTVNAALWFALRCAAMTDMTMTTHLPFASNSFGIPPNITEESTSSVSMQSDRAKVLRSCSLVVWDEGTVNDKMCFHIADQLLRDVMREQVPTI